VLCALSPRCPRTPTLPILLRRVTSPCLRGRQARERSRTLGLKSQEEWMKMVDAAGETVRAHPYRSDAHLSLALCEPHAHLS